MRKNLTDLTDLVLIDTEMSAIFPSMVDEQPNDAQTEESTPLVEHEQEASASDELIEALKEISTLSPAAQPELLKSSSGFLQPVKVEPMPLHVAAAKGDVVEIKRLLAEGLNVNQENQKSAMPIALASIYGHVEAVKVLIQHGADLNDKSYEGQTALHWAITNAHADVVAELLKGGANPLAKTYNSGDQPLVQAVKQLDDLTYKLLDYPEYAEHINQAHQLTQIIELLANLTPAPVLVGLEKADNVLQYVPVSFWLEVFSSYVADKSLQQHMQYAANQIHQIDPSAEAYLQAKTFLNTFATSSNVAVNLNHHSAPIMIHSDGFYAKYITQSMSASLFDYTHQLTFTGSDAQTLCAFDNLSHSYQLASVYAQSFASKATALSALDHYNLGETVILPTGWRGHSVAAILSKSQGILAIANAGKHYFEDPYGVILYKLADPNSVNEQMIHKILTNQVQSGLEVINHYEFGIDSTFGVIKTPAQAHGNCTHYSFKIAFEAALLIEYLNAGLNLNEAGQKAHLYNEKFEYFHHTHLIDETLNKGELLTKSAYSEVLHTLESEGKDSPVMKATAEYLKHQLHDVLHLDIEPQPAKSNPAIKITDVLSGWFSSGKAAAEADNQPMDIDSFCGEETSTTGDRMQLDTAQLYTPPSNEPDDLPHQVLIEGF